MSVNDTLQPKGGVQFEENSRLKGKISKVGGRFTA